MSLWFVDMNQRAKKPGLWSASWCAWSSWAFSGRALAGMVLMGLLFFRVLVLGRGGLIGCGLFGRRGGAGGDGHRRGGRAVGRRGGLGARHGAALACDPLCELGRGNDLNGDRHEAVAC